MEPAGGEEGEIEIDWWMISGDAMVTSAGILKVRK